MGQIYASLNLFIYLLFNGISPPFFFSRFQLFCITQSSNQHTIKSHAKKIKIYLQMIFVGHERKTKFRTNTCKLRAVWLYPLCAWYVFLLFYQVNLWLSFWYVFQGFTFSNSTVTWKLINLKEKTCNRKKN
jgi:hypothetical protein